MSAGDSPQCDIHGCSAGPRHVMLAAVLVVSSEIPNSGFQLVLASAVAIESRPRLDKSNAGYLDNHGEDQRNKKAASKSKLTRFPLCTMATTLPCLTYQQVPILLTSFQKSHGMRLIQPRTKPRGSVRKRFNTQHRV